MTEPKPEGRSFADAIEKFDLHLRGMRWFLGYIFRVQKLVPELATKIPKERMPELKETIEDSIDFAREIYGMPELGCSPPNPLAVDPNCADHLLSDHFRERLGRNHPLFDLVNAPFTHPIGTQIAMVCIDYAWNGYDTFVKALLGEIEEGQRDHPNVRRMQELRQSKSATDDILLALQIGPSDDELTQGVRNLGKRVHVIPEYAVLTFKAAKELRHAFAHRFGEPTAWLLELMADHPYEHFTLRMMGSELEVSTALSRNIVEVVQVRAHLIHAKASAIYTFPSPIA